MCPLLCLRFLFVLPLFLLVFVFSGFLYFSLFFFRSFVSFFYFYPFPFPFPILCVYFTDLFFDCYFCFYFPSFPFPVGVFFVAAVVVPPLPLPPSLFLLFSLSSFVSFLFGCLLMFTSATSKY